MDQGVQIFTLNSNGQTSSVIALQLTQAPQHVVLRLTGGFGNMDEAMGRWVVRILSEALSDFEGALLYGGTRIVRKSNHAYHFPTIGEVPTIMRQNLSAAKILGVVPRTEIFRLVPSLGMVISESPEKDQITIISPDQDICLQVQVNVDDPEVWDAEYRECMRIIENLTTFARWRSMLISFHGGTVTRREIQAWANKGWPVLLIEGGRSENSTDTLANDTEFRERFPNVLVAELDVNSIRSKLPHLKVEEGEFDVHRTTGSQQAV